MRSAPAVAPGALPDDGAPLGVGGEGDQQGGQAPQPVSGVPKREQRLLERFPRQDAGCGNDIGNAASSTPALELPEGLSGKWTERIVRKWVD